jgi:hypothetical protein
MLLSLSIILTALVCLSCAQGISPVISMARSGASFVSAADPFLRSRYEAELTACLALAKPDRDPCLARVRSEWAPIRQGLGDLRVAWCEFEPAKCQAQDATHNQKR